MASPKKEAQQVTRTRRAPARTPEVREQQLVSLALDLVEQRLLDGTASAQETTHLLKLGTVREQLERQKLAHEIEVLRGREEERKSAASREDLAIEALAAMKRYHGVEEEEVFLD